MREVTFKGNREAEIQEFPDPTPGRETPCCASARRGSPASTCTATGEPTVRIPGFYRNAYVGFTLASV